MTYKAINEDYLLNQIRTMLQKASQLLTGDMTPISEAYNPSTNVDKALSKYISEQLSSLTPFPVISEEEYTAFDPAENGYAWIIDPLDGTLNALTKTTPYCLSVALVDLYAIKAVLSCIFLPYKDEMYTAIRGKGAFLNGKKMTREHVAKKLLAFGLPNNTMQTVEQHVTHLKAVLQNGYITRQSGSTVHDVVVTALGRYSGFYQFGLFLWDFIGADLVAEECGCMSSYRRSINNSDDLRYDYIVARSAGELKKLQTLLNY